MGRRRKTRVDKDGVRRFIPNPVVRDLLDEGRRLRPLDMNEIWVRFCEGKYTKAQVQEFYQLIGYSVSGYEEIDFNV
jgi:hypothetical protein